jgi:hypothetical protein
LGTTHRELIPSKGFNYIEQVYSEEIAMGVYSKKLVTCIFIASFSLSAHGQEPATVGALLDSGGKKLTKDELLKVITGATTRGVSTNFPRKLFITYKEDKSFTGSSTDLTGGSPRGVFGTWDVDDKGNFCANVRNTNGANDNVCNPWFRLGEKYYSSRSDERNELVNVREVTR